MEPTTVKEVLEGALSLLMERGWKNGQEMIGRDDHRVCVQSAVYLMTSTQEQLPLRLASWKALADTAGCVSLSWWNDNIAKSAFEAMELVQKTLAKL